MKLLEMNHIRKSFGDTEVLKDISFSVEEGEVISIIGPSGSGKSTLLRCATLLEQMDGGKNFKMLFPVPSKDKEYKIKFKLLPTSLAPVKLKFSAPTEENK